jgi:hypothetical protein
MLIHYSIASFELLERKLTDDEKQQLFDVFYRVGIRMNLKDLPVNYIQWLPVRNAHMQQNLQKSFYTKDLFKQYKKSLGAVRYKILVESQKLVVPEKVNDLLKLGTPTLISPLLSVYKFSRVVKLDGLLKSIILPNKYKKEIEELDLEE